MNTIWRFYQDESRLWRWQQVSVTRAVLAESAQAYKTYEICLAAAQEQGYVYVPSKTKVNLPRARGG